MSERLIHGAGDGWATACGQDRANVRSWAHDPARVTCRACLPAIPSPAASTGASEDAEALAEACWLLDSGDPTWGWENLLPEQQNHHREQAKILAPVVERIVAAREAAARAAERERIVRWLRTGPDYHQRRSEIARHIREDR